ncbi:MAG: hypothetical protein ACP5M4_08525 [Acidobacteriaceae bacterium]
MKYSHPAARSIAAVIVLALCGAAAAQTNPDAPTPRTPQPQSFPGQVIFSRSLQNHASAAKNSSAPEVPKATNQQRRALTISAYHLRIHLTPRDQSISAEARLTLRNSSNQPLHEIALQLSSTLQFQGIGYNGKQLKYAQQTIASDADHTGKLTEADILLPTPLAPGATMPILVFYGGKIPVSGQRFEAIGTPPSAAEASDWDRISENFTGLRGFGNVVWYPVSSVPVSLGTGNQLFEEIGRQKQENSAATVSMSVTVEFFDQPPNVALLDGRLVPVSAPASEPTATFPGVVTVSLPAQPIGFQQLSLVIARRQPQQEDHDVKIFSLPDDATHSAAWLQAAAGITPLLRTWLGAQPAEPLAVIDLPETDDAPAQLGAALLTPLAQGSPSALATPLIHALARAYFQSPRGWLQEGVPSFLVTLQIESSQGRKAALEYLESQRGALAIAEPASPGSSLGQPLISAWDPIYVRTKSAYVFWMLRQLVGDKALQSALQQYVPGKDTNSTYFEDLLARASGKDLQWFFHDWVYQDPGLPDLSVRHVFPTKVGLGETLVAIDIVNHGYASCVVPVTLASTTTSITNYVRIPANTEITHHMEITGTPTSVQVNDGTVPEVSASIHLVTLHITTSN